MRTRVSWTRQLGRLARVKRRCAAMQGDRRRYDACWRRSCIRPGTGSLSVLDGIGSTAEWYDALHQRQAVLACDPCEGGLQELLRERPVAARCGRETIVGAFIQHHRTTRRKNAG